MIELGIENYRPMSQFKVCMLLLWMTYFKGAETAGWKWQPFCGGGKSWRSNAWMFHAVNVSWIETLGLSGTTRETNVHVTFLFLLQVSKCPVGTKPCLLFTGDPFEQDHEHRRLKNLFIGMQTSTRDGSSSQLRIMYVAILNRLYFGLKDYNGDFQL